MQFMDSSLNSFFLKWLKLFMSIIFWKKLDLGNGKGFHGYKYIDSFEKFKECFPGESKFYISLSNRHISDEDYEHGRGECLKWKI